MRIFVFSTASADSSVHFSTLKIVGIPKIITNFTECYMKHENHIFTNNIN